MSPKVWLRVTHHKVFQQDGFISYQIAFNAVRRERERIKDVFQQCRGDTYMLNNLIFFVLLVVVINN